MGKRSKIGDKLVKLAKRDVSPWLIIVPELMLVAVGVLVCAFYYQDRFISNALGNAVSFFSCFVLSDVVRAKVKHHRPIGKHSKISHDVISTFGFLIILLVGSVVFGFVVAWMIEHLAA